MATDYKVTELGSPLAPLDGTEVLYVVDGSTDRQTTTQDVADLAPQGDVVHVGSGVVPGNLAAYAQTDGQGIEDSGYAPTDFATAAQGATADSAVQPTDSATTLNMNTARLLGRTTASAGAVEEITVGSGLSLAAGSLTATGLQAQLVENDPILFDAAGSADGKYSGLAIAGTAGAALAFGDLCYLAVADSRWELADADAESTAGGVILGICVLAAGADGNATRMLLMGNVRADAKFPTLTIGAPAYVSTTTGEIQVAQPSGTDDVIRVVGHALTADELFFNPSRDWITHT